MDHTNKVKMDVGACCPTRQSSRVWNGEEEDDENDTLRGEGSHF
jgi:hypothetical protein